MPPVVLLLLVITAVIAVGIINLVAIGLPEPERGRCHVVERVVMMLINFVVLTPIAIGALIYLVMVIFHIEPV